MTEISESAHERYLNSPPNWADNITDVGSDVYVQVFPDRVHQVTFFHWCKRPQQWIASNVANTVLMIGDLLTLEKELYFGNCCKRRGTVSSGVFREDK